jgi:hypothetical protein
MEYKFHVYVLKWFGLDHLRVNFAYYDCKFRIHKIFRTQEGYLLLKPSFSQNPLIIFYDNLIFKIPYIQIYIEVRELIIILCEKL